MYNFSRYFVIFCLLCITIGAIALGSTYRHFAVNDLIAHGKSNNQALSLFLHKQLWLNINQDTAKHALPNSKSKLQNELPKINTEFNENIKQSLIEANIAKLKIYNISGKLLFTTDHQSEKDSNEDNSFITLSNTPSHELTHKNNFYSLKGVIENISLFSSNIPIQQSKQSSLIGMFEIHMDVSSHYQRIKQTEIKIFFLSFGILAIIFGVLIAFIKRAKNMIKSNEDDLNKHIEKINTINRSLKESAQELAISREKAEDHSMFKSNFIANMSHELRTPLNAIIGFSEILQESPEEFDANEISEDSLKINTAAKSLLGLINDLLDISKIEAGKMDFHIEQFDIPMVIEDIAETVKPLAEKNKNQLITICDRDFGITYADLTRTRQSIYNLLSNACKFTKEGTITLSVSRVTEEGKDWILYNIKDTGIGLSAEHKKAILKDANDPARTNNNVGLGLAISKRFCEMMGGNISVDSKLGEGSSFTIKLPSTVGVREIQEYEISRPTAEDMRMRDEANSERRKHISRVLIIDDDQSIHALMSYILRTEGYLASSALSGKEGLVIVEDEMPDAIILDIMMPEMDGWAVLKQLKNNPKLDYTPIIMLSALGEMSMSEALGADGYITKPFNSKQVIDTISNAIRTKISLKNLNQTVRKNRS